MALLRAATADLLRRHLRVPLAKHGVLLPRRSEYSRPRRTTRRPLRRPAAPVATSANSRLLLFFRRQYWGPTLLAPLRRRLSRWGFHASSATVAAGEATSSVVGGQVGPTGGAAVRHARPHRQALRHLAPRVALLLILSITMAAMPGELPDMRMLALFAYGSVLIRGVGCTINDLLDRDIDRKVINLWWSLFIRFCSTVFQEEKKVFKFLQRVKLKCQTCADRMV
ncbi:hypothetical protein DAI22_08g140501 [Oryza sativa Japonica Group]|nr:hypothetical protein DAI22_08g140501 [Oryza sativa Japonica Group]